MFFVRKPDQNLIIARGNLRRTFSYYIFVPHFVLQKSIIGSLPLSRREQKHDKTNKSLGKKKTSPFCRQSHTYFSKFYCLVKRVDQLNCRLCVLKNISYYESRMVINESITQPTALPLTLSKKIRNIAWKLRQLLYELTK